MILDFENIFEITIVPFPLVPKNMKLINRVPRSNLRYIDDKEIDDLTVICKSWEFTFALFVDVVNL